MPELTFVGSGPDEKGKFWVLVGGLPDPYPGRGGMGWSDQWCPGLRDQWVDVVTDAARFRVTCVCDHTVSPPSPERPGRWRFVVGETPGFPLPDFAKVHKVAGNDPHGEQLAVRVPSGVRLDWGEL